MKIKTVTPKENYILRIESEDGRSGDFDVKPYLGYEVFLPLKNTDAFNRVRNGCYYVEWDCGADLSADTIEANWKISERNECSRVAEEIERYGDNLNK